MSDKDTLLSMGFESPRVEWALKATQNRGLQPALDFLVEHSDDPVPDPSAQSGSTSKAPVVRGEDEEMIDDEDVNAVATAYGKGVANVAKAAESAEAGEVKSIKCSVCGKIFRDTALANFHAEKMGHDQFEESTEEIKPLTEEEKAAKLADLRAKLAEKRAKQAVEDAKADQANILLQRKAGKDNAKAIDDMKKREADKAMAIARREKIEDKKAKDAIRAQIEADKKERREKFEREKALRLGLPPPEEASSAPVPQSLVATSSSDSTHKETRLSIRMMGGSGGPYNTTLPSEFPLGAVAEFLASQTLTVNADNVHFTTGFPRKQYGPSDYTRTLKELGLTPSAVLMVSKTS